MHTHRNIAVAAAGIVTMAACSMASLTAWLLVTSPATVAMAVEGHDLQPLAQLAWTVLYEAVARLVRYR